MTRKVPLPKITECFAPAPRTVSVNDCRITKAVLAFTVLAVLSVGHIYLRFLIRDMKLQQSQLVEQSDQLQRHAAQLESDCAKLCDSTRLRAVGRYGLHMVEESPQGRIVASVPDSIASKYAAQPLGSQPAGSVRGTQVADAAPVQQFLMSLVDVNKAYAAEH